MIFLFAFNILMSTLALVFWNNIGWKNKMIRVAFMYSISANLVAMAVELGFTIVKV